jgi:multiple sugar transport system substrate-binding protein
MKQKVTTSVKIAALLSTALLVLTACGQAAGSSSSEATGAFDWKRHQGTTLKVNVPNTGQVDTLKKHLPEFEQLTGMKVNLESSDVNSYRSSLPVKLTARSSDFDVMATFPEVDGQQFEQNGWYVDLDKYISNKSLTNPDFEFADFPQGVQNAMKVKDKTATVLWEMQTDLMYYRKDLLAQAGLEVPKTFEQWEQAAEKIHNPEAGIYGVALRGIPYQTTTPFASFLYANCGAWTDGNKAAINTPEAVQAYETYGRWGSKYGPPGINGFDWPVPSQQFQQGKVFAFLDVNLFVPDLQDKTKSKVAGNVGFAPVPEGKCGRAPFIGGWGYAISPFSKNADAAWTFIQWATSKDINLEMKLKGWPSPRTSAWESADFKKLDPNPEFTSVVLESTKNAKAKMNPPVAPGVQAREIAGLVANKALDGVSGAQIQELADTQNKQLQNLIDQMGR